jgi:hypothetical protein
MEMMMWVFDRARRGLVRVPSRARGQRGVSWIAGLGILVAALFCPRPLAAQELTDDEVITLGLMGEELLARGIDGSYDGHMVSLIETAWAYRLSGLDATPTDAREVLRFSREDRELRSRMGINFGRGAASSPTLVRVQAPSCEEAKRKAQQARSVANALKRIAWMYAYGGGLLGSTGALVGAVEARFLWPIAFGSFASATVASYAEQLAQVYETMPCATSGPAPLTSEATKAH